MGGTAQRSRAAGDSSAQGLLTGGGADCPTRPWKSVERKGDRLFGSAAKTCKYWDDPSKAFPGTSAGFWFTETGPDVWEKPHSWTWKQGPLHLGRNTSVCSQAGQFLLGRKGGEL